MPSSPAARRRPPSKAPAPLRVELDYKPRRWALPFHESLKRWAVIILHRRAGKTIAVLNHHQRAACDNAWEERRLRASSEAPLSSAHVKDLLRNRRYGHILPTLKQAKLSAWDPLKYYASKVPGININESELRIDYPTGSRLQLFGADNPDGFRGLAFSGVSFDEYSQHPPSIFSEVVSKALADHLGYAIFAGTIKGKNQLWKTYEAGKKDPNTWFSLWQDIHVSLATEDDASTVMLRQAMHDDQQLIASGVMTQEEYDQEWFLSAEAAIKGSYYSKLLAQARKDSRIRAVPWDPALKVHDVWDLGKGPNMSVGLFQKFGREVRMIEYVQGSESDGLPQMIAVLQRKPYVYGKHFAPHDIAATDLSTGKTRLETAKQLGWSFDTVPDIGIADGIAAAKLLFPRLWVDEKHCELWLETIGHYRREWFDKLGRFGDNPVHDFASHPADMFRYAAVAEEKMVNDKPRSAYTRTQGALIRDVPTGQGWMAN